MKPWTLKSSKDLIKNKWLHLKEEELETESGGKIAPFYRFITRDWGLVIPRTVEGDFILVKQYRRGIDDFSIEFPAGVFEVDENDGEGVLRELSEETGYHSAKPPILLGSFFVNPANQAGRVVIYFVDEVELTSAPENDPTEEIEVLKVSKTELQKYFDQMVISHPIHHLAWYCFLTDYS